MGQRAALFPSASVSPDCHSRGDNEFVTMLRSLTHIQARRADLALTPLHVLELRRNRTMVVVRSLDAWRTLKRRPRFRHCSANVILRHHAEGALLPRREQ
jgi:hypothetical protein